MNKKLSTIELNRISVGDYKKHQKIPVAIILDNIRSLNNIGSVFRTADAFLIEKIYLCGITAKPPHREIQKTALGATESVDWEYHKDPIKLIHSLKEENTQIIVIEQVEKSILLDDFELNVNKNTVLIFGNEVQGVSQELVNLADFTIEIPQFGTKHSLNISVSAGIVLWDLFKPFINKFKK